ncbi:TIM21-domain-containing protein [Eremomyces bilateralis CBS 781.70]|uniref:Mitochondrial import inner membrane translocase subunit Tim21 n=1 Tax=Eremomyces bilateralis CBS 781.70 TaxID=1392243 RepID=A0A6G1G1W1_9PEZI|nr:TIM21-domain-containing protein [Eremomyces bilateralis CBS 781.70]KAF1811972.1 TIM21-domain-containing protein [Eremomyces bilateralis CBS 781.70]
MRILHLMSTRSICAARRAPLSFLTHHPPRALARPYATQSNLGSKPEPPRSQRKAITVISDDGRVQWNDLSMGEKAARTTQQSFNFLVIVVGVVLTGGVSYFLYKEVFATDSKTRVFDRAVERIKDDPNCVRILGDPKKIYAHGEASWNKWTRNRSIASRIEKDRVGMEHLYMHFHVDGPVNRGICRVHMTRRPGGDFEYYQLYLDVQGHQRIFLENEAGKKDEKSGSSTVFGVKWW